MRRALRIARGLLAALLLVGLAGYLALGSERATRALVRGLAAASGGAFAVGEVGGSLRAGLRLRAFDLRLGATRLQAAALDWQPGALRWRELALGRIAIDELRMTLGDGAPAAGPPAVPRLAVPGRITLDALEVRGLALQPAGGAVQRIDRLRLAGQLAGSRLHLRELALAADGWSAQAALRLDLAGAGALDGLVQARLVQPGGAPLALHGSLGGSLEHGLQAALRAADPAPARLLASLDAPLAGGPWQAHLWLEGAPLAAWRPGLPPWPLAVDGRARGRGAAAGIDIAYRLEKTPAGTLDGRLGAQGEGAVWRLTAQARAAPGSRVDLAAAADLTRRTLEARLDWQALRWPLGDAPPRLQSPSGSARLDGRLDDWALTLQAALTAEGQTGELAARLRGDTGQARLEALDARLLDGRLHGAGELHWAPALRYAASLQAAGLDPGLLWPKYPGRVALDVAVSGDAAQTQLQLTRLGGRLRGQPLAGSGAVVWQPGALRLSEIDLRLGRARLRAAGSALGAGPPLEVALEVPAAGELLAGARGRLSAKARLAGPGLAQARLRLDGADLAYADLAAKTLSAALDLDRPQDRLALRIAADGVAVGGQRLALDLAVDGAAADHAVQLDLARNDQRLALAGRGGLLADGWQGRFTRGTLRGLPPSDWALAGPLALELRRHVQSAGQHCWRADEAQVCAGGRRAGADLDLAVDIRALPLAPLVALGEVGASADGALDGHLRLRRAGGPLQGELRLAAPAGALSVPAPDGSRRRFAHGGLQVDGRLDAVGGQLVARLAQAGGGDLLDATLRLPPLPAGAAAPLSGALDAQLPDIGFFEPWLAQVEGLAGRATARFDIGGTLAAPRLAGEAAVLDARAAVPALGIELRDVQASVRGDGGDTLRLSARARSGDGTLQVDGDASRAADGPRVRLELHGERFQALDTTALQAQVSPHVDLEFAAGRVAVRGEIAVPRARIHAQDQPAAVRASPDVVVLGREAPQSAPLTAQADLRVVLGDDMRVDAYGFEGRLGGAVRLEQHPDGSTAVSGTVRVEEGQYAFYGQRLPVTEGELRYAGGPPDNPALRITAERTVGEVTAGVRLRGTAKAPETELFSTPAMAQADILSYLLLGRPLQQAKGSESELLMQAAASAGLRGGGMLVKRLGSVLGLDEAKLGGDGNGGASLALGRYLTPRLYVGYGLALAGQGNAVTLRYTLTRRWLLEVVSGLTQTADVLYQLER
ncbi:translocation/assembly module TamB domain-containing protein [Immundisolibacter sp.]|uniref:translocation/assembly module TamB domain-containing protein n=1 Tax=Immundisolibacter sp. TaxID=1934948 RepID=UPI00261B431D|nr:translocation/assembly module TamB domain-containing protein [Immundisolibacter sp.]MDD3650010.1 translocation/assembly module TamB domain-containing protein [Immundisolibacter sp.]